MPSKFMWCLYCFAVSVSGGCTAEKPGGGAPVHRGDTYVAFRINVEGLETVKSLSEEDIVNGIGIYAFRDGRLEASVYTEEPRMAGMYLEPGKEYRLYAVANAGEREVPENEGDMESLLCSVPDMAYLNSNALPMSSSCLFTPEGSHAVTEILLTRLVSKIGFKVDAAEQLDVQVKYVKLCGAPAGYRPFAEAGRCRSGSGVTYEASSSDVDALNEGRIFYVYTLENCPGDIFPGNTDPRRKIPENIPANQEWECTWIEAGISVGGGETVARKFCLGEDAVSDCNLRRNTYTKVTLFLTGGGDKDYTWKVGNSGETVSDIGFVAAGKRGAVVYADSQGEIISLKVGDSTWNGLVSADGGRCVLVGENGSVAYSDDGLRWHESSAGTAHWQAVVYGDGRFIAAGYTEEKVAQGSEARRVRGYIAQSQDGKEWAVTEMPDFCWNDIAYGGGRFVATGFKRPFGQAHLSGRFAVSADGQHWEEVSAFSRDYPCIIYGNGIYVAMDGGMCTRSLDGISWESPEFSGVSGLDDIAYGGGTYVAAGRFGDLASSFDCRIWEKSDVPGARFNAVDYSCGYFLVSGDSGTLCNSADGKTWDMLDTGLDADLQCACIIR